MENARHFPFARVTTTGVYYSLDSADTPTRHPTIAINRPLNRRFSRRCVIYGGITPVYRVSRLSRQSIDLAGWISSRNREARSSPLLQGLSNGSATPLHPGSLLPACASVYDRCGHERSGQATIDPEEYTVKRQTKTGR